VVFKDSILGGARQFWGNPYLNSTTVLFDDSMACTTKNDMSDLLNTVTKYNYKNNSKYENTNITLTKVGHLTSSST